MQRLRFIFALTILLLLALLVGCGGGSGNSTSQTAGTGKAVITIQWPDRSRLIPDASNSVQVTVNQGTKQVGQQLLARPASGSGTTSTATFDLLPVGTLSVTATAFPNADGTGNAQATATAPVVIQANQVTPFDLGMNSTIDHLEVTTPSAQLAANSSETLSMVAKDASGAIVLTSPAKIQWSSSDPTLATVDQTGKVTGLLMGMPTITVTDTESGKSVPTSITVYVVVTVSPNAPTLTLGDTQNFTATVVGSANQGINWSVQEGAAGGAITPAGIYTAPQKPGIFHIIAASQADITRTNTAAVTVKAGTASGTIQ